MNFSSKLSSLVVLLLGLAALSAWGANPGDEVVVIYNSRMPESRKVAEYYAEQRHVPANQVVGFELSTGENMSRAEFRDRLQQPLAKLLEERKLWHVGSHIVSATTNHAAAVEWRPLESKVRYAVLCYGVPLRILPDPNLKEPDMEKMRPEMRRDEAAVDSELALLPVLQEHPPLHGPLRNPIYTSTNAAAINPTNGVLMVTRLDGPSSALARGLVDKALQAEATGLWGRAYFDLRNIKDPGYKLGDDWLRMAAELCRRVGLETVVDENPGTFPASFPLSQVAFYAGWYDQDASGPFTCPTVEFMPGAFAYHLHSFSANTLRSTNKAWVGPLVAKGATITMGCVNEPYLTGTPNIGAFAVLLCGGFTFGEAAYASQSVLSWQTTVVGDPLYRPYGKTAEALHAHLLQSHSQLVEWAYLLFLNNKLASGRPAADAVAALEQLPATKQSAVLTEKLGDLYAALGKPSSAAYAYAQALKLQPSPQQRLRLLLTRGEKLTELGQDADACADYQELLQACPDYPDKAEIYRKLLLLARKLGKQQDVEKYQAELDRLAPGALSADKKQS